MTLPTSPYREGQWVCFSRDDRLVIGRVLYTRPSTGHQFVIYTTEGSVSSGDILEAR